VLINDWQRVNGIPTNGKTQPFGVINDYVMDRYGSKTNFKNFIPVRNDINGMKARIMGTLEPMNFNNWEKRVSSAEGGNDVEFNAMITTLHEVRYSVISVYTLIFFCRSDS